MCVASKNCEKINKKPLLEVQGRSRSLMLINLKSLSPVLVMICSMSVPICNRFHTIWANNDKITSFRGYQPIWRPRSRGTPAPKGAKFCHDSHEKLETLRQPTVKISWFWVSPFWYSGRVWWTDRQTDRWTDAQATA